MLELRPVLEFLLICIFVDLITSEDVPPIISQGFSVGAKENDKLFVNVGSGTNWIWNNLYASIYMVDKAISTVTAVGLGTTASKKKLNHGLQTGLNGHPYE